MSTRSIDVDDRLADYLTRHSVEPDLLEALRVETGRMPMARMQISPEQGKFLGLLVELVGARRIIEIGVFTGYSSLSMALAMPTDGQIIACDVNEEWTSIAARYWDMAGVKERIDLRLAPALETLDELISDGDSGNFDLAFIDADKENYRNYYEKSLELLRPGGLVVVDNALWSGRVADESYQDDETESIRTLNSFVTSDPRVTSSLVPVGDGVLLARKR
jgi:predicted O-methyltransferase YrrM